MTILRSNFNLFKFLSFFCQMKFWGYVKMKGKKKRKESQSSFSELVLEPQAIFPLYCLCIYIQFNLYILLLQMKLFYLYIF